MVQLLSMCSARRDFPAAVKHYNTIRAKAQGELSRARNYPTFAPKGVQFQTQWAAGAQKCKNFLTHWVKICAISEHLEVYTEAFE
jgi:hypothetical protein